MKGCRIILCVRQLLAVLVLTVGLAPGSAQTLPVITSWLGNSFSGASKWVQNHANSFYVAPDGTCYTQSIWDEGHFENAFYRDGNRIGKLQDMGGGLAVTGDGTYIFAGEGGTPNSASVRRFFPNGNAANFSTGNNQISLLANTKAYALAARYGTLYVSDPNNDRVVLYGTAKGTQVGSFGFTRPGDLVVERGGAALWIVQSSYSYAGSNTNAFVAPARIVRCSTNGAPLGQEIADVVNPAALAVDNLGRLLVADFGPAQQVRAYTNLNSQPVLDTNFFSQGTFGDLGGVFSGARGQTGPRRFYKLNGVGADAQGNLYVCNSGPVPRGDNPLQDTDIRKFDRAGVLRWQLIGKEFVDMGDFDPASGLTNYCTKDTRYALDWGRTNAGAQATFAAHLLDPFRYPQDPRLYTSVENLYARRIGGALFLFGLGMAGDQQPIRIWRFSTGTDGEMAVPCAYIHTGSSGSSYPPKAPVSGEYYWKDSNQNGAFDAGEFTVNSYSEYPYHNGTWPDSQGNLWTSYRERGIRKLVCTGLDSKGMPNYRFTPRVYYSMPSPFTDVHAVRYYAETDTMYLSGFTTNNPNTSGSDKPSQVHTLGRYDHWTAQRSLAWISNPSDLAVLNNSECFDVAGDYVFVVGSGDNHQVYVFRTTDGTRVGLWQPGAVVGGPTQVGWVDIWDGGVRAFQRDNGEYIILVEEDYRSKTLIYRWCPSSGCTGTAPMPLTASIEPSPASPGRLLVSASGLAPLQSVRMLGSPDLANWSAIQTNLSDAMGGCGFALDATNSTAQFLRFLAPRQN